MKNSIVVALLIGSAALTGQLAFADDREAIAAAVADDVARPVRQGGVDGQAYWNVQSVLFMYPPAFDFPKVDKAVRYRYVLEDDARHVVRFESETPNESLSRVWAQLPVGTHRLEVLAVNAKNRVIGMAGYRRFWKSAAFCPDDYPKGVCGYDEAAKRYFDWLFEMKNTKCYLENGLPDEDYTYNAYPSKMDSALINACVNYAKIRPDCKDAALTVARRAAEHLLSLTLPPGSPLENFPRTYRILKPSRPFSSTEKQADNVARAYQGMNMLLYPASAGGAYIKLYEATGERRYLDAAIGIAETYIKLQGDDGTWYLKVWEKDGSPVAPNRLFPLHVCSFLERLRAVTGQERFRVAADKAFAFVEKGPLSNWNWEGQFEDVEPSNRYRDLTPHDPVVTAIYLLSRYPDDMKRRALARECLRFAEDQFVMWKGPFNSDGTGAISEDSPMISGSTPKDWFEVPGVCEQYDWYLPIDSAAAKMINGYLAFYELEKKPVDLAKARALGDAITIMQAKHSQNGAFPTHWVKWEVGKATQPWINCGCYTANALIKLDDAVKGSH